MTRDHQHNPDPNENANRIDAGPRSILIGIGGMMAGGFAASIVDWSPAPKALLVGLVAAVVALAIGVGTRSSARS